MHVSVVDGMMYYSIFLLKLYFNIKVYFNAHIQNGRGIGGNGRRWSFVPYGSKVKKLVQLMV